MYPAVTRSVSVSSVYSCDGSLNQQYTHKLHFYVCRALYPIPRSKIGLYIAEKMGFSNSGFHRIVLV
jgi:hypothetical protein